MAQIPSLNNIPIPQTNHQQDHHQTALSPNQYAQLKELQIIVNNQSQQQ